METVLLLDNQDLAIYTQIGGNVDPQRYQHAIRDAQKMYLKPALGSDLYERIMVEFDTDFSGDTTGVYKQLYDEYVFDVVVHYAASLYLSVAAYQVTNAGVTKTNTDNTVTVDKSEVDYMVNHQRNMAQTYERQMLKFIAENIEDYPEFPKCDAKGKSVMGWYFPKRHFYRKY